MSKFRWALLSCLLVVPLLIGCDTGAAAPTAVVNPADATAATTAVTGAATEGATAVMGAATAATTAMTGAATAATTAVNGALTAEDTAYLTKANALVTQVLNSPDIAAAATAMAGAAQTAATGGAVDTAGLNDKLTKAGTFLDGISQQASALQPSPNMKSAQDELMKGLTDWQSAIKAAQTAVGSNNMTDLATAAAQVANAAAGMVGVQADFGRMGTP
jgi:trimeric autotransporter adhesin